MCVLLGNCSMKCLDSRLCSCAAYDLICVLFELLFNQVQIFYDEDLICCIGESFDDEAWAQE